MKYQENLWWRKRLVVVALALLLIAEIAAAQNLGSSPQLNVAVQGQTGAQPEGAFLNFINWVGNVISPVGAGGAIVGAVVSWLTGRGFGRWLFADGGGHAGGNRGALLVDRSLHGGQRDLPLLVSQGFGRL